ncbi:hypothetical protein A9Q98_11525 [Thalassotalea sp. 42_200_T64]|nr:hypothetical protein A9Q98_11525 [Thalassotalea sp. 42_200_T64]
MGELIPIVLFIMLGVIGWAFFYYAYKGKHELQETIQVALEKGQQLSPESIEKILQSQRTPSADFKRGILLISLAVATGAFGLLDPFGHDIAGVSLLPLVIGIGYLIVWKFSPKDA